MTKLVWRIALSVVVVGGFLAFKPAIEEQVLHIEGQEDIGESATDLYQLVALVGAGLIAIILFRGLTQVASAGRAIARFEQPYRTLLAAEKQRHQQALAEWQAAVRRHHDAADRAQRQWADGPRWFPVYPASEPTRIDIVGGDSRRNGWASLLVTLGTSVLARRHQITLLDLTGQDVGGGLLGVAQAYGLATRRIDLPGDGLDTVLLHGLDGPDIAESLAYALSSGPGPGSGSGDQRQERALTREVVERVVDCLDGAISFGRIAAGIDVLRQVTPPAGLAAEEISRLAENVGELGRDEWTTRQMHFVASQLRALDEVTLLEGLPPDAVDTQPLWDPCPVRVVATEGGPDDRKELLDRLLVQLAQRALGQPGQVEGFLVVAGADDLGATALEILSDHARNAGVRLVLLINQPQGDLERTLGTGGAVCIMKMYNHRDANIAADFVGRGYKFVVSQVTFQVGKTFSDGGGDNFSAATNEGSSRKRTRARARDISESRGHTWSGTRNWSLADNVSDSRTSTRVYELTVEPQQILGLPETAFILVDNSGPMRQVVVADSNPGICLLDRVALTAAAPETGA
ncbi:MAG: hypothetical protein ACRD03_16270 [Acidimicrobiales bacterium]